MAEKYDLLYFYLGGFSNSPYFLQKKFIMSDYGTDGYNETA